MNTCSIDYFLFSFWCQTLLSPGIKNEIAALKQHFNDVSRNNNTIQMIDLISDNQWDRVKTLWILDLNGMKPNDEWQFQHLALNTNI